ncbi:MAG: hypothetical protein LBF26_03780 [Puniceicoccales bacterium]|nr:hypothetical protein [Puniceicoccales bacterium]
MLKLPTRQAVSSLRETLERQKAEKRAPDLVVEPATLTQSEPPSTPMLRRGMADRLAIAGGTTGGGAMWGLGLVRALQVRLAPPPAQALVPLRARLLALYL